MRSVVAGGRNRREGLTKENLREFLARWTAKVASDFAATWKYVFLITHRTVCFLRTNFITYRLHFIKSNSTKC